MKRALSFLLLLMMVLPLLVLPAGAVTTKVTPADYDKTSVAEDLNNAMIGSKKFDVADYPYDKSQVMDVYDVTQKKMVSQPKMQIITLQEIAPESEPTLYLYVYNPTNARVSMNDLRHAITLSVNDAPLNKYALQLLSSSGIDDEGQLYLKFKVNIPRETLMQMHENRDKRTYQVSEIELYLSGANATAYKVGGTWEYTGTDTSASAVKDFMVLDLDIGTCVWRTDKNSKGNGYKTQVDSAFFAIPNDVLRAYGNKIAGITYRAYEYDTGYMLVCTNDKWGSKLYQTMKDKEGVKAEHDDSLPTLNSRRTYKRDVDNPLASGFYAKFVYNDCGFVDHPTISADILSLVLQMASEDNEPNIIIETDLRKRLSDAWAAYNNDKTQTVFSGDKSKHEITPTVKPDEPLRIDTGSALNGIDWFKSFVNANLMSDWIQTIANFKPIQIVEESDFDDFEAKLLVDPFYKDDLKQAFDRAGKDKSLVLMHFATSDYFGIAIESNSKGIFDDAPTVLGNPGFVAKETVYMDFDIISLDFVKDGEIVTIPVAASPVHAIGDLEYSDSGLGDGVPEWVIILIAILILVVVVILCPSLLPILVKIVILPFRLLWWLVKALGRGISGLIRSIKERKK